MNHQKPVHLYKLLNSLSLAMDFSKSGLMNHHQRVCLLSLKIAETMGIPEESKQRLFCSAIIHDAGTSTWQEKARLEVFEIDTPWEHCQRGFHLIKRMNSLAPAARIILSHHDRWEGNNPSGLVGNDIPLESRIIHLADRVDILAGNTTTILNDRHHIMEQIQKNSKTIFDPNIVDAFTDLGAKESLWLDLNPKFVGHNLETYMVGYQIHVSHLELQQISDLFARIIDGKSPFTYRHSRLVAEIATFLAEQMGFKKSACQDIKVAGLLHDLGKLTIPEEILEKPGKLNQYEFNIIKQHTYYTYQILNLIDGFNLINKWASFHHEKLNGTGYPFRLNEDNLCDGSRLMAVSDIYSALVENRPYRRGFGRQEILKILSKQIKEGAIDQKAVNVLEDHIDQVEKIADHLENLWLKPDTASLSDI